MCRPILKLTLSILMLSSQYLLAEFLMTYDDEDAKQVMEYAVTYDELYRKDKISTDIKNEVSLKNISESELQKFKEQFASRQEKLMLRAKEKVNLSDELFNKNKKPMELDLTPVKYKDS